MTKHIPIRSLLKSLNEHDSQVAHNVLVSFNAAIQTFPRPDGVQGVELTAVELERYQDGWDAAIKMGTFLVCMLLGYEEKFLAAHEEP